MKIRKLGIKSFGKFKDKEIKKGRIVSEDEIGLLTGASGVILTILSCYKPVATKWDSIFLI
mgnify:CR=1 FL=1